MKLMKTLKLAIIGLSIGLLAACGQQVEIPPASVAKVMTKEGYREGVMTTSKFRLDMCMNYCDKLVLLNAGDQAYRETLELVMPQDKLKMTAVVQLTLSVNPKRYDEIFTRIAPKDAASSISQIELNTIYTTYAQQIIRSEAREFLSQYKISDILANLDKINADLSERLAKSISERTPFQARFVGLADVKYPEIIVQAQEKAAERREQIEQENAQLEISKVQLARELQEQKMRRAVEVAKADSEAQVNHILAASMSSAYIRYRELQALDKIAESPNKVFVPVGALNSFAVQKQIGN